MLKIFATSLRQHLGPDDIAGRLGGDEFAVLLAMRMMLRPALAGCATAWMPIISIPANLTIFITHSTLLKVIRSDMARWQS